MRLIRSVFTLAASLAAAALVLTAGLSALAAAPRTVSLQELEQQVQDAPQVLVAAAELEQSMSQLETEQAISGWKVFGGAGGGRYQEAVDDSTTRDYNRGSIRAGLRYPLLGTRQKEQVNMLKAEARTWESRQKIELARRISLNALRGHYINYWAANRRIELSQAFLQGRETLERILAERLSKGFLLDADRQEFLTALELAGRNTANARATQKRALAIIAMLTRSDLTGVDVGPPVLPSVCLDEVRLKAQVLDDHPELALRRGLVEEQLGLLKLARLSDLDANVELGGFGSADIPGGTPGYGVGLSLNLELPAGIQKANQARQNAARAALKKNQLELNQRSDELLADAAEAVERTHAAEANLRFARQRVKAALESLRESQLRSGYLPGDTLEKLQQSRFQYYQTSLDLIEAEGMLLQARAALLQMAPEGCGQSALAVAAARGDDSVITNDPVNPDWLEWPKTLPPGVDATPRTARGERASQTAVYLWESAAWIDGALNGTADWEAFRRFGIDRILVSLDGRQIAEAATPNGGKRLRAFLENARRHGLSVELLLGEPLWILPGHRQDLLRIIQQLSGFDFDGLHLDLEPDQLDAKKYAREYLLAQLLHTLQAAARVSPWPLAISIHPRYFDRREFKICLGCALAQLPVAETVLMIYVSNPEEAARRASAILAENPRLRWSVALSVEPFLSPSESYADKGLSGLRNGIDILRSRLAGANFSTVMIQSWIYLETLKP